MNIPKKLSHEKQKDYAVRAIRDAIVNWELAPGTFVSEGKLALELGISRNPVREALQELAKTRIIEVYPQRGTRIAELNYDLIMEAEFCRRVMDCAIVELACTQATEEDFSWFEDNLKMQRYIWRNGTAQQLKDIDQEYHRHYYEICRKMQCYELICEMNIHFDRLRHIGYFLDGSEKLVDDHQAIFEAVRDRDPVRARELTVQHLIRYQLEVEETDRMAKKLIAKLQGPLSASS